jgi:glycerate-2-kinase
MNTAAKAKQRRKILLNIVDAVLKEISPQHLFKKQFPKNDLSKFERIALFSIGKAAKSMAQAVIKLLPRKPDEILLADTGHPLPTKEGILKTQRIIRSARSLGERDLGIVLISGGGSAMLVSPVPGITLADKIDITKSLLKCGAPVQKINVVRKHLSQIKGGRLTSLLYPATIWGFIISDVVGNDLSTIASGPLTPDKSTFSDALRILKKYHVKASPSILRHLEQGRKNPKLETPKPGEKYFNKVSVKILADHHTVAQKAAEEAKKMGLEFTLINKAIIGEARDAARSFISRAKKNRLLIGFGETTVTVRGRGYGGRNQEFVLSALKGLKDHQTLLSIGTDGVDGICPQPIAGAIADSHTLAKAKKLKLDISSFLRQNNSYAFFKKTGGLIKTGPTGTNLGDLMLLLYPFSGDEIERYHGEPHEKF